MKSVGLNQKAMKLCGCTDCSGMGQHDNPRICSRGEAIAAALRSYGNQRIKEAEKYIGSHGCEIDACELLLDCLEPENE